MVAPGVRERPAVLHHPGRAVAGRRLFLCAADVQGELHRRFHLAGIATSVGREPAEQGGALLDFVKGAPSREPALAEPRGPGDGGFVVTADVEGKRVLHGLRVDLELLERIVRPGVARRPLGQQ